jgi:hypothetical protein
MTTASLLCLRVNDKEKGFVTSTPGVEFTTLLFNRNLQLDQFASVFVTGKPYPLLGPRNLQTQYNSEELYFMLLVTLALETLLSISQNGINQITLNKKLENHLNNDIINVEIVSLRKG